MYKACEIFLHTKIPASVQKLKVFQAPEGKNLSIAIGEGEKAIDIFEGIQVKWEMVYTKKQSNEAIDYESRSMELSFPKKNMKKILSSYLPYVVDRSEAFIEENKVLKLYSYCGSWESTNLNHPSTFETLAMDSKLKQDLDQFVKRKKHYKRFRRLLVSIRNQSILVIEDIDCSSELQGQQAEGHNLNDSQLMLYELLNSIDGLWSSCGDDKQIITLASNYLGIKDHKFPEIEKLIVEVEVTPAAIAEELMKSEEAGIALRRLVVFLKRVMTVQNEATDGEDTNEKGNESPSN
ncbi:hypothetical protein PVL29_001294 [Vitis rotundifolia]|uniref:Uncharacterized protein n=1 Tax=Vitis rotundifolia TaxID=103349 RepID=A0AA39E659_VITRO|nr:hypothetical protein PVL29_001294 [Vitis rotundifolia]